MIVRNAIPALLVGALAWTACAKKKKDDTETTTTPEIAAEARPGAIMLALDDAMGSIAFKGQGAGLNSTWFDTHCKNEDGGTKSEYEGQFDIMWGCLLTAETDGPDTPRGAMARVKALACTVDNAIEAGTLKIDGEAHTINIAIKPPCWSEQFSDMVKEEMPDKLNADGWVAADVPVTAYKTVPEDIADADKWSNAFKIEFSKGIEGTDDYTLLTKFSDELIAGSILAETKDEDPEIFAMSITFHGGEDDLATFRYEGRFPFGMFGDNSEGSRHLRVIAGGPYTGNGTFSAITSGEGFQAEMFGAESGNSGRVMTYKATADGLHTKTYNADSEGAVSGTPTTTWGGASGTTEPTAFNYTGTAAEKGAFLKKNLGDAFTASDVWHKAHGPLDFESVTIDGQ